MVLPVAASMVAGAFPSAARAAAMAFPGAEGFAALVTGGRKGQVYHVTTLADAGPGSLRDAVSQSNRTVVFDVSGVVNIASRLVITGDNITLAGQSAPGNGIAIYGDGTSFSSRKNIIVRYLRFRQGIDTGDGVKAVNITDGQSMIFDHVSVQWGRWDNFGITGTSATVTLQNSIIGEGIDPQRFGSIIDSAHDITVARNLWIDNQSRNPKFKANGEYINNVVYDWGGGGGVVGGHSSADWFEDLVNNYLIAGPAAADGFLNGYASTDRVFQAGNLVDLNRNGMLDGRPVVAADFQGDTPPTFEVAAHNKPPVPVTVVSAAEAYARVLATAGTCLRRDAVEQRLVDQLRSLGTAGAIITDETLVGGQPPIASVSRPATYDTDGDGMSDAWETAHGLDPKDASDGNGDFSGDGYTNLEKFLATLADEACPAGAPTTSPPVVDAGAPPPTRDAAGTAVDGTAMAPPGKDAAAPPPPPDAATQPGTPGGREAGVPVDATVDAPAPSAGDAGVASGRDAAATGGASPAGGAGGTSPAGGCGCNLADGSSAHSTRLALLSLLAAGLALTWARRRR